MFQGNENSYTNNSGNSYTYVTNNISVSESFKTHHSHNGHGRGGWCGVVAVLGLVGIPILFLWFIFSLLTGWLT